LTSGDLAKRLGVSQQTAARHLAELTDRGLIARTAGPRGQEIELTRKGLTTLRSVYQDLAAVFADHPKSFELKGKVVSGLGEGKYYVGQEGYRRQFERKLGFAPYPGTLDIELDRESVRVREALQALPGIGIEGFRTSERTFGPVKCFEAKLRGRKVGAALPSRTHRPDVVELVAPVNLRKKLKLSNGSAVKIEVMA